MVSSIGWPIRRMIIFAWQIKKTIEISKMICKKQPRRNLCGLILVIEAMVTIKRIIVDKNNTRLNKHYYIQS